MIGKTKVSSLILALAACSGTAAMAQASMASGDAPAPASPAAIPAAEDAEGRAIFEANCSSCHEISDATSQAKDLAGWTQTIEKMISYGAPVAFEDQQRIAVYLAATYPAPTL